MSPCKHRHSAESMTHRCDQRNLASGDKLFDFTLCATSACNSCCAVKLTLLHLPAEIV